MNVRICVLLFASATFSTGTMVTETAILLDSKPLGQTSDTLPSWNGTVCSQHWEGITCISGVVTGIDLNSRGLQGSLPESWSNLTNLRSLDLSFNNISGTLPESWGRLANMNTLVLANNSISGVLPESWGSLATPSTIHLRGNQLQGSLPISWSQLSSLKILDLSFNSITGFLPAEWLTSFQTFSCFGHMGLGFANPISAMAEISLNNNNLRGSIPYNDPHFNGHLILSPMNVGFGLCGAIPDNLDVCSWYPSGSEGVVRNGTSTQLTGTMPLGACTAVSGPEPGPNAHSPFSSPPSSSMAPWPSSSGISGGTRPKATCPPLPAPSNSRVDTENSYDHTANDRLVVAEMAQLPKPSSNGHDNGTLAWAGIGVALGLLSSVITGIVKYRQRRNQGQPDMAITPSDRDRRP